MYWVLADKVSVSNVRSGVLRAVILMLVPIQNKADGFHCGIMGLKVRWRPGWRSSDGS